MMKTIYLVAITCSIDLAKERLDEITKLIKILKESKCSSKELLPEHYEKDWKCPTDVENSEIIQNISQRQTFWINFMSH